MKERCAIVLLVMVCLFTRTAYAQPLSPPPGSWGGGPYWNATNMDAPSDSHGAIGQTFIVLKANTEFTFIPRPVNTGYNTPPAPVSDMTFWGPSLPSASVVIPGGGPVPTGLVTIDPMKFTDGRVLYDPYPACGDGQGRWLVVEIDQLTYSDGKQVEALLVAVSTGEDPRPLPTNWTKFAIASTGSLAQKAVDMPQIGFNTNWIAVQSNNFFLSSGAYSRALLYLFQRSPVECAGTLPLSPGSLPFTSPGFCQNTGSAGNGKAWYCESSDFDAACPAETYETYGQDLDRSNLYLIRSANPYIDLYRITGAAASPVYQGRVNQANILTQPYPGDGTPWSSKVPNLAQDDPTGTLINAGPDDDRFTSCVVRNYGIWAVHAVGLPSVNPTTAVAQFWNIGVDNYLGQIYHFQRIGGTTAGSIYDIAPQQSPMNVIDPSIGVNYYSDLIMGFNVVPETGDSPPVGYLGAGYAYKSHSGTSFYAPYLYRTGYGPYYPGCTPSTCTGNRTGDYTHATVDPNDDYSLWTVSSAATAPRSSTVGGGYGWAMYWAEFFAPEPVQPTFVGSSGSEGEFSTTDCPETAGSNCQADATTPSGVQPGDWLFASIEGGQTDQLNLPSGWKLLTLQNGSKSTKLNYPKPCDQVFTNWWLAAHRYSGTGDSGTYSFSIPTNIITTCGITWYIELGVNIFAYRNASRTLYDPTGQPFYSLSGNAVNPSYSISLPAASLPDHMKAVNLITGAAENEQYEGGCENFADPTGIPTLTKETPLKFCGTVIPQLDADVWTGQGGTFGKYTFSSDQNSLKEAWQLLLTPY